MTLKSFYAALSARFSGRFLVFYDHIDVEEGDEVYPPYFVVRERDIAPFHADNVNYWMPISTELIVLTPTRDKNLRSEIASFLTENEISYNFSADGFNTDYMCYQDVYTLDLDEEKDDAND